MSNTIVVLKCQEFYLKELYLRVGLDCLECLHLISECLGLSPSSTLDSRFLGGIGGAQVVEFLIPTWEI